MNWRPITGLRTAVMVLLSVSIVTLLLMAGSIAKRLTAVDDFQAGRATLADLNDADLLVQRAAILFVLVFVATGIVWVVWQWRLASNLKSISRTEPKFGPGWSIGGWLIPCANYIIPGIVLMGLWRASGDVPPSVEQSKRPSQRPAIVIGWWVAYIVGGVLFATARSGETEPRLGQTAQQILDDFRNTEYRSLAGVLVIVVSGVLAAVMVNQLTQRSEALLALRSSSASWGSTPTPGWFRDPAGIHELRYWDGATWTDHVMGNGAPTGPPSGPPAGPPTAPPPGAPTSPAGFPTSPQPAPYSAAAHEAPTVPAPPTVPPPPARPAPPEPPRWDEPGGGGHAPIG